MTITDDRTFELLEEQFSEEGSWMAASAQGTGFPHSEICHLYPFRGSRQPACGAELSYPWVLDSYHAPGPCPNGIPLCPECYG